MYSTQAIILKNETVGEANAMITCYTEKFGKIKAVTQGVRKENAKLKGHLEKFTKAEINFIAGEKNKRIIYARGIKFYETAHSRQLSYAGLNYISELVDRHCFQDEKDLRLWNILLAAFEALDENKFTDYRGLKKFFDEFENKFIAALGFEGGDLKFLEEKVARPPRTCII